MHIRLPRSTETDALVTLWRRSVVATHTFLAMSDVEALLPIVRDKVLGELEVWVLENGGTPMGFMALYHASLEALFIDPEQRRRGGGRLLLNHARSLKGPLTVDVNEQNPHALQFYLAEGFEVVGRSELDGTGRPFPLLHLRDSWQDS